MKIYRQSKPIFALFTCNIFPYIILSTGKHMAQYNHSALNYIKMFIKLLWNFHFPTPPKEEDAKEEEEENAKLKTLAITYI